MKKMVLLLFSTLWIGTQAQNLSSSDSHSSQSQSESAYWQQEVHYDIHASLNDSSHMLTCSEKMEYINHSPDTLKYIWFHLWPNGYRNKNTAYYKQISALDIITARQRSTKENGFIDSLHFTVDGKLAMTEANPKYIDIIKVILPENLVPGGKIEISTPFVVKIPPYFSRLGYEGSTHMISQWYPKPAVYDRKGWHEFPYLDQGEFYSEFGSFDVFITLPSSYVVGATGILQNPSELKQYKEIGHRNLLEKKNPERYHPEDPLAEKTLEYKADSVHDFAWFADKYFIINYDTLQLSSGKIIDVFSFFQEDDALWENSVSYIKDAVTHYSAWIGEYSYPVVSAVEGPRNIYAGGMEYPMITLISRSESSNSEQLDDVITHEVGHNWFYGMLGTNEREHPWMDEGINTYYEFRYEAEKYKNNTNFPVKISSALKNPGEDDVLSDIYFRVNLLPTEKPIETPSASFPSEREYAIVVYDRTALWLYLMEKTISKKKLELGMQAYFRDWKFKHPYPEDMESSMEQEIQIGLKNFFFLLNKKGSFN